MADQKGNEVPETGRKRARRKESGSQTEDINREFKKLRRRRRGERRLKNEFTFHLRISRHSEVIYFVYHCQTYHETESRTQR